MNEQIKRVAIYGRVSTEGQNVDLQLAELNDFIAKRGWRLVGEYVDRGVSGSQESRPALNQLMNDARQRRLDVIAVWKLDRFARSVKHVVVALSEFEALGIAFVSLKDNLDLTTPSGRFMFQIIAAFGELERAIIAERVKAGLQNAKRRGKRLGRPQIAVDAAYIVALRSSGASWRQISARLGVSVRTIRRAALGCGKTLTEIGPGTP
jgi:DNA invertase Pin-like site-specific DNA recombinase